MNLAPGYFHGLLFRFTIVGSLQPDRYLNHGADHEQYETDVAHAVNANADIKGIAYLVRPKLVVVCIDGNARGYDR